MGCQTHPTIPPTLVFSMLDEMLNAFDRGFTRDLENMVNIDQICLKFMSDSTLHLLNEEEFA